jgi:hypothetical protein
MRRTRLSWIILGAVVAVVVFAGVDALRSSLGSTSPADRTVPTGAGATVISNEDPACNQKQMAVSVQVRKPDETRPVWNQREALRSRAWQRTPVATLVVKNVGSRTCLLAHGRYDFGIKDRANRWMARWEGNNVFAGSYVPAEEKSFSLPNVFSCDRPAPFSAIATVGHYAARLDDLSYDQVTCTRGRLA